MMTLEEDKRINDKLSSICKWNTYLLDVYEVKMMIRFFKAEIEKAERGRVDHVVGLLPCEHRGRIQRINSTTYFCCTCNNDFNLSQEN